MPQFDLKGKGDFTGLASKTSGEYAAKNQGRSPGAKNPVRGEVSKPDSSETKKSVPAPNTLNYFMRKTEKDGKGNAKNRAYTMWKRYKQSQRRGA
jgi:hypothetical protein